MLNYLRSALYLYINNYFEAAPVVVDVSDAVGFPSFTSVPDVAGVSAISADAGGLAVGVSAIAGFPTVEVLTTLTCIGEENGKSNKQK
jgi:hypothetical protein